jgi:hypothetical protein
MIHDNLLPIVYKNIDTIAIIIVGQPRYIGTKIWKENFINVLKSTILEHSVHIDITFLLPEFDTIDKTFFNIDNSECGLPNINRINKNYDKTYSMFYDRTETGEKLGKIKIKKDKIENCIKSELNFINNIEFVYYDPYIFVNNLELAIEKEHGKKIYFHHGHWLNQHNCVQYAYNARHTFFDSLSEITPIIKVRYDYFFSNKTLWRSMISFLDGSNFNNTDILSHNNLENLKKIHNNPKVMLDKNDFDFLYGNLCSPDYIHFFNKKGLTLFAKEFINWCFEDGKCLLYGVKVDTEKEKFRRKPEIILNQFFIDKCYHIKMTELPTGDIYRYKSTEIDYYRYKWYEWSIEKIEEFNKIQTL